MHFVVDDSNSGLYLYEFSEVQYMVFVKFAGEKCSKSYHPKTQELMRGLEDKWGGDVVKDAIKERVRDGDLYNYGGGKRGYALTGIRYSVCKMVRDELERKRGYPTR